MKSSQAPRDIKYPFDGTSLKANTKFDLSTGDKTIKSNDSLFSNGNKWQQVDGDSIEMEVVLYGAGGADNGTIFEVFTCISQYALEASNIAPVGTITLAGLNGTPETIVHSVKASSPFDFFMIKVTTAGGETAEYIINIKIH